MTARLTSDGPVLRPGKAPDEMGLHMNRICDGCSSNAAATVYLRDGRLLDLCDHHAQRYEATLLSQGALVVSDMPRLMAPLTARPGVVLERVSPARTQEPQRGLGRCRRMWAWLSNTSTLAMEQGR